MRKLVISMSICSSLSCLVAGALAREQVYAAPRNPSPLAPHVALSPVSGPQPIAKPAHHQALGERAPTPLDRDVDCPVVGRHGVRSDTSSPFEPPDPAKDKAPRATFVINSGGGLDTGCTFRSGGPLIIQLPITRYMGETNANGTLKFPFTKITNRVISRFAELYMPAYDVDFDAQPPEGQPERDRVLINGHVLGFLTGQNEVWKENSFLVPIEWLKFPSAPGVNGQPPTPVMNEIRIDIDVANTAELWCTAIDWAAITFKALSPILLVHGVNAQSDTWDPDVTDFLNINKIVYSKGPNDDINLEANGSIAWNALLLFQRIDPLATQFGARDVHIVAHSKGGLDSRMYLSRYAKRDQVKVLSLYTLSTPHHGSILATISRAGRTLNDPTSDDYRLRVYLRQDWVGGDLAGQGPQEPALSDLTVAHAVRFNRLHRPPQGPKYYSIAADADLNGDFLISEAEAVPVIPAWAHNMFNIGTLWYHILCCVQDITVRRETNWWGWNEWHVVNPVPQKPLLLNDLAVTEKSAQHSSFTHVSTLDRNHSNMKDGTTMQMILNQIDKDFPVK